MRYRLLARVGLGLLGLTMLIAPGAPGANAARHRGEVLGKILGGALLLLSVFPFRMPQGGAGPGRPEEL